MIIIKSIWITFRVWVLAALFNALFIGTALPFLSSEFDGWVSRFLVSFIFTLIFSIPALFIFWIVLLVNWNEDILFRSLLQTGIVVSAISSLVLYALPLTESKGATFLLSLCVVIATISSIMMNHRLIKSNYPTKNQTDHV
jgi:hypothetical protein